MESKTDTIPGPESWSTTGRPRVARGARNASNVLIARNSVLRVMPGLGLGLGLDND